MSNNPEFLLIRHLRWSVPGLCYIAVGCSVAPAPECIIVQGGGTSAGGTASGGQSSGGSNDGGTNSGGTGGTSSGGSGNSSSGGTGGDPPIPTGEWSEATGNLVGLSSECGNLGYVSAAQHRDMVIAGVATQGLFALKDGATEWELLGQGAGSDKIENRTSHIVYDPDDPDAWWQAGAYGPCGYRTEDNGDTFTQLGGDASACDSIGIDFTDPERKTLLAGGHEAHLLFRSTNGGESWSQIGDNVEEGSGATGFVLIRTTQLFLLSTWQTDSSGIFRSTDGGDSWTRVHENGARSRPLVASDGAIYWVTTSPSGGSDVIKSTDEGETWEALPAPGVVAMEQGILELPDGRLVTRGSPTLIASSDKGETWVPISSPLPYSPWGMAYSPHRSAFYVWRFDCNQGNNPVASDAIMKYDFDYTAE